MPTLNPTAPIDPDQEIVQIEELADMPDQQAVSRELSNILNSGEIASIFLGGTTPQKEVIKLEDLDNIKADISYLETRNRINNSLDIDIDTIVEEGYHEVNQGPFGHDSATMKVERYEGTTEIRQKLTNDHTGETLERYAANYAAPVWDPWIQLSIPTYYVFDGAQGVKVTTSRYQQIAAIQETLQDGVYEIKMSLNCSYSDFRTSAFFRYTLDGANWIEFTREPTDITDNIMFSYVFPYQANGAIDYKFEARCETTNEVLDIHFLELVIERKA